MYVRTMEALAGFAVWGRLSSRVETVAIPVGR
jgi:hypothetical protein